MVSHICFKYIDNLALWPVLPLATGLLNYIEIVVFCVPIICISFTLDPDSVRFEKNIGIRFESQKIQKCPPLNWLLCLFVRAACVHVRGCEIASFARSTNCQLEREVKFDVLLAHSCSLYCGNGIYQYCVNRYFKRHYWTLACRG